MDSKTSTPTSTVTNVYPTGIKQSSISVAVRVRPFTVNENNRLVKPDDDDFFLGDGCFTDGNSNNNNAITNNPSSANSITKQKFLNQSGIRKIVNVVDDRMLIFDPPETNPLAKMQKNAFPNSFKGSRIREHKFVFDRLFDEDTSQNEVYQNTTRPLLDSVLDGYNATVFAYGATGCGKTHTISGTVENPGVIFLTMKELYEKIGELSDTKIVDVSLSYLEIYNETIRDLLNPETDFKKLIIREDSNNKISVSNLSRHRPESVEEVMQLIMTGNANRTSSPTEANATSSRSHAVLQINIDQKNRTGDVKEEHTFATLSIIDLAGSERAAATKNRGARLNEGANINKSLLALGNCINALCDPRRRNHIPYRDSKLTRLLKFSLGGNCKTVMIVCVSPSSQHYDETLNTLKYADRAKEIKTKLIRNQHNLDRHVGSYLKMITEQKQEIEELRARENQVVGITIDKRKKIEIRIFQLLQDTILSVKRNIAKYNLDKSKKIFMLAKRKVLLRQKVEIEILLEGKQQFNQQRQSFLHQRFDQLTSTIYDLCEQIMSKIDHQIFQIESQYRQRTEIDHILGESAERVLKRLEDEEPDWTLNHSIIYDQSIQSIRDDLQSEILVKSSALYDHLIYSLADFYRTPWAIAAYLANHGGDGGGGSGNDDRIMQDLLGGLEKLVNGTFDGVFERFALDYLRNKTWDETGTNNGNVSMRQEELEDRMINDENVYSAQLYKKPRTNGAGSGAGVSSIISPPRDIRKPSTRRMKTSPNSKTKRSLKLPTASSSTSNNNNSGSKRDSLALPATGRDPKEVSPTEQADPKADSIADPTADTSMNDVSFQNNSDLMFQDGNNSIIEQDLDSPMSNKQVQFFDLSQDLQMSSPPLPQVPFIRSESLTRIDNGDGNGRGERQPHGQNESEATPSAPSPSERPPPPQQQQHPFPPLHSFNLTESKMSLLNRSAARVMSQNAE
ncbi:KIP3 [Candida margitis]|uniref:KIP3 n=1 Tax=Candida margitis TaxID=1775924 RepID=UPI0022264981|nr:KIP3 [Candida margitis]KAI5969785.1 KIP3 [Candida margitis]